MYFSNRFQILVKGIFDRIFSKMDIPDFFSLHVNKFMRFILTIPLFYTVFCFYFNLMDLDSDNTLH